MMPSHPILYNILAMSVYGELFSKRTMLLSIESMFEMHPIDKNETICFSHLGVVSI